MRRTSNLLCALVVLAAAAVVPVLTWWPSASADVANPGPVTFTAVAGSGNLGATAFNVDPAQPIVVSGTIAADGAVSVPSSGVSFPSTTQTASGVTVTVNISANGTSTGSLDAATGAAALNTSLRIDVAGIPFGGGCNVTPIDIAFTTGTSGPLTGAAYDPATGLVRLVAADFAIPTSSGCGPGAGSVDSSISGTGNLDLTFAVTPTIREGSGNIVPAFTANPQIGTAPLTVGVDASATTVTTGTVTEYAWNFGDGTTATGVSASHTYSTPGNYTIQLNVTDSLGGGATTTRMVAVGGTARRLSLTFAGAYNYDNTAPITTGGVTVSKSRTGTIAAVAGVATIPGTNGGTATAGFNLRGFFGMPIFTGSVSVVDAGAGLAVNTPSFFTGATPVGTTGATGTLKWMKTSSFPWQGYTLTWKVEDWSPPAVTLPPNPSFTATPSSGVVPETVAVDASASTDPNPGGGIQSYAWDFGDGATATGATASHAYAQPGSYVVVLTVINTGGASAQTSRTVSLAPLVAPSNLRFTGSGGGGVAWDYAWADIAWDVTQPVVDGYELDRGFIAGCILNGDPAPYWIAGGTSNYFRDSGEVFSNPSMCRGTHYQWRIRAKKGGQYSDWSPWIDAVV